MMKKTVKTRRRLLALLLCVCVSMTALPLTAMAAGSIGGSGTSEETPLEIGTAAALYEFASMVNDGSVYEKLGVPKDTYLYVRLTADLNLYAYAGGEGWNPIGSARKNVGNVGFKGSFDGGGHTVSGLAASRPAGVLGLFGVVLPGSVVRRVALADITVERTQTDATDNLAVGGIAGVNEGTIEDCSVSGTVTGTENAGLAAGSNQGTIARCVTVGDVSGEAAGGIAGMNDGGSIQDCAALVRSVTGAKNGRITPEQDGTATGCISWDGAGAGDVYGTGKWLDQLKTAAVWPEGLRAAPWHYTEGGVPSLSETGADIPAYIGGLSGLGTAKNPYRIGSWDDFLQFAESVKKGNTYEGKVVALTADITMGDDWEPIEGFGGTFDGKQHWITRLTIDRPDQRSVGLFGRLEKDSPATLRGVILIGCKVKGNATSGALVGEAHNAVIENCYVGGSVTTVGKDAGGLVGAAFDTTITGCMTSGVAVTSLWGAAGIVSYMEGGRVADCYTTGVIHTTHASSLGGVVAHVETADAVVERCYSTAILTADGAPRPGMHEGVGGVVGVTTGVQRDLMAINDSITAPGAGIIGRTAGKSVGSPDFYNVRSWVMMPVNGGAIADSQSQGYSAAQLRTKEAWAAFQGGAWRYSENGLPVLKNIPSNLQGEGYFPPYLRDNYEQRYEEPALESDGKTYHITKPEQLAWLSLNGTKEMLDGKTLSIEADLSLADYQTGSGWTPISNVTNIDEAVENLTVNGNGHTLTGLTIRRSTGASESLGLFGTLKYPVITNLTLSGVDLDVSSSGTAISDGVNIGSLCGTIQGGQITGCTVDGAIRMKGVSGYAKHDVGGLIGQMACEFKITSKDPPSLLPQIAMPRMERCSNQADITAQADTTGGLVGRLEGILWESYNTGNVASSGGNVGGLVGEHSVLSRAYKNIDGYSSKVMMPMRNCYNRGDVSGQTAGGITGNILYPAVINDSEYDPTAFYENLYSTGTVTAGSGGAGGIVGSFAVSYYEDDGEEVSFQFTGCFALGQMVKGAGLDTTDALVGAVDATSRLFLSFPEKDYYWQGMELTGGGETKSAGQGNALSTALFNSFMANDAYWPDGNWTLQTGKLPILTNTPGRQDGAYPMHLALSGTPAEADNRIGVGIHSAQELCYAAEHYPANNPYYTFYLENDVDMAGVTDFTPFQTFAGRFNGGGHAIQNLVIDRPNESKLGLFAYVDPAGVVENLSMVDCIVRGQTIVGTIAGECHGMIQNCAVTRSTQAELDEPNGWQVTGYRDVGGIAGQLWGGASAAIRDCYAAVNVRSENGGNADRPGDNAGGLVGDMYSSNSSDNALIRNVFAAGRVVAAGKNAGGVVGRPHGVVSISGAFALGDLVASGEPGTAGQIVGVYWEPAADKWNGFYAWDGTQLTGTPAEDGKGKVTFFTADELAEAKAWRLFEDDTRIWSTSAGATPTLKALAGVQNNYLPLAENSLHLRQENGVYLIGSARDLLVMGKLVDTGLAAFQQASYRMDADISLRDQLNDGHTAWNPIGPFKGTFDGDGHTLSGFAPLLTGDQKAAGLFGVIESGGTVKNLTIQGELTGTLATNANAGLAAAIVKGTLINVTVEGSLSVEAEEAAVGGLTGLVSGGTVKDCTNRAGIQTGIENQPGVATGGIAGKAAGGTITGCVNTGNLAAVSTYEGYARPMGGIAGSVTDATVSLCRSEGSVTALLAGGIAGQTEGSSTTVERCASLGPVYGSMSGSVAGGIVSNLAGGKIEDCYTAGTVGVTKDGGKYAGGIAGSMTAGEIRRCYAIGTVSGNSVGGGIVGLADGSSLVISNVAALNPSVSDGYTNSYIGLWKGNAPSGSAVYTWDGMTVSYRGGEGEPISFQPADKETIWKPAFWSGEAGFDLNTVWEIPADPQSGAVFLPILRGMDGQDGSLPLHLQGYLRDETTVSLTLLADNSTTIPYTGGERTARITADLDVQGAVSALTVVWSHDGGDEVTVNPVSNTTYDLTFPADFGGDVTVTAYMKDNPAVKAAVNLTVVPPVNAKAPVIDTQPQDAATVVGKPVTLSVAATSLDGGALTYQWYKADLPGKDGTFIDGARGASYEVPATQTESVSYYCVVTNTIEKTELVGIETATARSEAAQVTVTKDAQSPLTIVGGSRIVTYGDAGFALQTSGGSGTGAVTWQSGDPDVVSVDGTGKIAFLKASDTPVTITATKAEDHQYKASSAEITVTVNKKTLTVTADDKSREYGQANPALTYTITGFVNGESETDLTKQPAVYCFAGADAAVGTHPITVSGGEAENYEFVYVSGALTVTKTGQETLYILQGAQISKTYGDSAFTLSVTGGSGNGAVTWQSSHPEIVSVDAGTGRVTIRQAGSATVTATKAADGSFVEAQASATVTVGKAVLTVTAEKTEKQFGEANPELNYTITGFVNGENKTVLQKQPVIFVDTAIPETELPVGSYVIKVEGGEAGNYTFVYNNATLIVNKADQSTFSIEGGNLTKTYGDAPFILTTKNGAGGAVTWQSGDETVAKVDGNTGKITVIGAGKVQITAISAETGNFSEALAAVTLTVEKAKLQIKADPQTRVYGEENPAFTYRIEGFVKGDEEADLDQLPVLTADADGKTGVGSYAIRLAGGEDDNYAYILNNAELTITPRPITIKADDKEMTEGGDMPELTWSVTEGSLVDSDGLSGSLKAEAAGAGKHPITQDTPFANPNYTVTFLPGELTVLEKRKDPSDPMPSEPTHPDNPQTGDGFPSWTLLLLLLSMGGIVLTFRSLWHRKER